MGKAARQRAEQLAAMRAARAVASGRDFTGESVFVATPVGTEHPAAFTASLLAMVLYDMTSTGAIAKGGGPTLFPASSMNLPMIRNELVKMFLDDTPADWLLWLDSDAGFEPNVHEQLMVAADPAERPIVGALAYTPERGVPDTMGGFEWNIIPTVYDWRPDDKGKMGLLVRHDPPEDTVTQVAATGCHCILIHRSAMERLRTADNDWYTRVVYDGDLMGEDFSFSLRCMRAGIPMFVHTGIQTNHIKTVRIGPREYESFRLLNHLQSEIERNAAIPGGVAVIDPLSHLRNPFEAVPYGVPVLDPLDPAHPLPDEAAAP